MDSKKFNIYAGSILGGLLIFLLLNFFSHLIYQGPEHPSKFAPHEKEVLAFAVPIEKAGAKGKQKGPDWSKLLAKADPAHGKQIFHKCQACHSAEKGKNGVGPSLYGIVGEKIADVPGYSFSSALKSKSDQTWTLQKLFEWLKNPQAYAPGTKMTFTGLPNPQDRVDVISYLNQQGPNPVKLTPPKTAQASGGTSGEQAKAAGGGENLDALLAKASADKGKQIFHKCQACHSIEKGKNGVGPSLYNVIGQKIADVPGYSFSSALKSKENETWTLARLNAWLTNPQKYAPGTKMTFPGLKNAQDRIDVLTYIDQANGKRDLPQPGGTKAGGGHGGAAQPAQKSEAQATTQQAATQGSGQTQQATGQAQQSQQGGQAASAGGGSSGFLANADPAKGKQAFRKCQACHSLKEGKTKVGPSLYHVVGRKIGSVQGFSYSDALKNKQGTWTPQNLDAWIENPNKFIPGNRMPFPGIKDAQERKDLIAYLKQEEAGTAN